MIKHFLLFFTLSLGFQLKSQTVASSCTAPVNVVKLYQKDADRLALRRSFYTNSTYKDSVKLDLALRSTYLAALLAVYNATMIPARDTVVTLLNLHTNLSPEMNSLKVTADPGNAWMQSLMNNTTPTNYAPIDNLLSKYHLAEQNYFQSSPYDVVFFKSDSSLNMQALAARFATVSTVISASAAVNFNDVKNIQDSVNTTLGFTILNYSYGWGTCENGCDARAYWSFKVYNNCTVEYLGQKGNPFSPVGIRENELAFGSVQAYPNPANDKLTVVFGTTPASTTELQVINTLGQVVLHSALPAGASHDLDLSALNAGIYYVHLKNDHGSRTIKLVKE